MQTAASWNAQEIATGSINLMLEVEEATFLRSVSRLEQEGSAAVTKDDASLAVLIVNNCQA